MDENNAEKRLILMVNRKFSTLDGYHQDKFSEIQKNIPIHTQKYQEFDM